MKITLYFRGKIVEESSNILTEKLVSIENTEKDSDFIINFQEDAFLIIDEAWHKHSVIYYQDSKQKLRMKVCSFKLENGLCKTWFFVNVKEEFKNLDIFDDIESPNPETQCSGLIFKALISSYANTKGYYVHRETLKHMTKESCKCVKCKEMLEKFYASVAENNHPIYTRPLNHQQLYKLTLEGITFNYIPLRL